MRKHFKRTSSESFSSRNKAHQALCRSEKLFKKDFDVVFSQTTSRPLTDATIQTTGQLKGDNVTALYGKTLLNGTESLSGTPGWAWPASMGLR